jgi:hypothetical protein
MTALRYGAYTKPTHHANQINTKCWDLSLVRHCCASPHTALGRSMRCWYWTTPRPFVRQVHWHVLLPLAGLLCCHQQLCQVVVLWHAPYTPAAQGACRRTRCPTATPRPISGTAFLPPWVLLAPCLDGMNIMHARLYPMLRPVIASL